MKANNWNLRAITRRACLSALIRNGFNRAGNSWKKTYVNGTPDGTGQRSHENGQLWREETWRSGAVESETWWEEDGTRRQ
jgi:antitoxin component YwqK of YwqJK toxin-antitoxin module